MITQILFFSAYPTWKPESHQRHRIYIKALTANGVTPVLGKFKQKPIQCRSCKSTWTDHEKKESDVNLALLFPEVIYDAGGNLITTRPAEYAPPKTLPVHERDLAKIIGDKITGSAASAKKRLI